MINATRARIALLSIVILLCYGSSLPIYADEMHSSTDEGAPSIHFPRVVGFSPGKPFLFRFPASGNPPLMFTAIGLPSGLAIDKSTGVISGSFAMPGTTKVTVNVTNALGSAHGTLTLDCGTDQLAQTPPMGWVTDNVYGVTVTDADIRSAADELLKSGLASHGYQYIFIGDSWEGKRTSAGDLNTNSRFPDMKALASYVHSKGLKLGLYSSATSETTSGYAGSAGHETSDAKLFSAWGIDAVTYDWAPTTAENDLDQTGPFVKMGAALRDTSRDILYIVQVFKRMSDPEGAGEQVFQPRSGVYDDLSVIMRSVTLQSMLDQSSTVKRWTSLGPLFVGRFGYPDMHISRLTNSEQQIQFTLWSLFSAPLTLSCDLAHINPNSFSRQTSDLLTNDEVLAIDQDTAAYPPVLLANDFGCSVWMKPLADGRKAVAFINSTNGLRQQEVDWSDIEMVGPQPVRDLWNHMSLGTSVDKFSTLVPPESVVLVAVGAPVPQETIH